MLTKGIVEELIPTTLDNKEVKYFSAKVRIPIYDRLKDTKNATPTSELSEAVVCTANGMTDMLQVDDIVWIAFEDNDTSKPVVIGHLYRENSTANASLNIGGLTTNSVTQLNENTSIGNVTAEEIKHLRGVNGNLQAQLDMLKSQIASLTARIEELESDTE